MSNGVEVLVKDKNGEEKQEQTKYMEVKTIQPSAPSNMYASNYAKIDKRIDSSEDGNFDLIQSSEISPSPCTTTSCSCSQTESLKTKYTNIDVTPTKYGVTTKHGAIKLDLKSTNANDRKTQYGPYEYKSTTQLAPVDKVVEKYTEVVNDYSDEKDSNSLEESELLTNEQAPPPPKPTKAANKTPTKNKPEKTQKPNKNKVLVEDLLKLGSLGIKGLSQLAPVLEKMTGSFIKRQDTAIEKTTTSTEKPPEKVIAYHANKRVDSDFESKQGTFPIYIPVDEMETSESQMMFTNATLHQNLVWAAEHKQPKSHHSHKIIHESPLVNGGIPISPGEIITTNSDVIVGKPAVGGPLTLAASGIKLHNPVNPPPLDSFVAANEEYLINDRPLSDQSYSNLKVDDSYDLRPPELPKPKANRPIIIHRPNMNDQFSEYPYRMPNAPLEEDHKSGPTKPPSPVLINHGRPAFLDYIPSFGSSSNNKPIKHHLDFKPSKDVKKEADIEDNSPSSSEIVSFHIKTDDAFTVTGDSDANKPFLVDIQPSRVANVLIPHGSSTALVFSGSSEPHKTGDYIDDPLPYPEPGYFGSFSIDAPQMTNVHNVAPNNNKPMANKPRIQSPLENYKPNIPLPHKDLSFRNDLKLKWKETKHSDFGELPPPTSNQETHVQVGPQITAYDPKIYSPNNGDFDKYNIVKDRENKNNNVKEVIDKEYEKFLAVPPPPPKMHFNQGIHYDKNKPYNQRPIVQHKPVQDMKVFLSIQHPVPKEQRPPKVTSEIYFASQGLDNKPSPTYTIQMPPSQSQYNSFNMHHVNKIQAPKPTSTSSSQSYYTFPLISSHNIVNKSISAHDKDNEGSYTVTLNTATNVASNTNEAGQVIGSSVPVPVETTLNNEQLNANIPIETNFAIRVEENTSPQDTFMKQDHRNPQIIYEEHNRVPFEVTVGDNRWNKSSTDNENTIIGHNYYSHNDDLPVRINQARPPATSSPTVSNFTARPIPPSVNSHANFPMLNDHKQKDHYNDPPQIIQNMKPVAENAIDIKNSNDQKRPGKHIPNVPTNTHGWYSSVIIDENKVKNIDIKSESTTRKVIPLHEYSDNRKPSFGQKITSAGKPPSEFWSQKKPLTLSDFNVGKPFSVTKLQVPDKTPSSTTFTVKPNEKHNYLPSNFGIVQQPAYDIPIRDNSDETTTIKAFRTTTQNEKPVYENSEEIYDGDDNLENIGEDDGEVSSESMKIPVVSTSNEVKHTAKTSTELTLLQDEVLISTSTPSILKTTLMASTTSTKPLKENNKGTQTEKPFNSNNKTNNFLTNAIKPIYDNISHMKPRPFTMGTLPVLDHQLQQPHWQINQLLENSTNISYEDNLDLNIGEEMNAPSTIKTTLLTSSQSMPTYSKPEIAIKYKNPPRPVYHSRFNNTKTLNDSHIITSTVHIKDKRPLIVEKPPERTTLPAFTITADTVELNISSSEIIDLSPPPPTIDYSFKPSPNDEMIMGMSPPPPRNPPGMRQPPRIPLTPRPGLLQRTPASYRTKPPKTLPPRLPQRPSRKPVNREEISTYKPNYDIVNNIRRPIYNHDQPSSQLLPPPREKPSQVINPIIDIPPKTTSASNIVFPTPISSGWLTSSGIGFSSSFNFDPTSVHTSDIKITQNPVYSDSPSAEDSNSYEVEYSSETVGNAFVSKKPVIDDKLPVSKENNTEFTTKLSSSSTGSDSLDSVYEESSQENSTTDRMKVIPIGNKNRTRKPYPFRNEDKKSSPSKVKLPTKPTATIHPTRTLSRPEILYPTRHTSTRKIVRPIPTRSAIVPTNIIESSESTIEEDYIKPTEVLKDIALPTISQLEFTSQLQKGTSVIITSSLEEVTSILHATHHAGNEIIISDEVLPTKTEFRTTVVTLAKTLSEPPLTVSSIGYVNLTHTLTVTHTKTSLISQSEGAITQTLILTNTHTSTIVDVITEIHTKVQPTTIVETVTKHIPVPQPTLVQVFSAKTKIPLDEITMSSEEEENLIIQDRVTTENAQKVDADADGDNDTFFVVMNKSQNGGPAPPISTDLDAGDYDLTRNEQVNNNGVSQVLFGEILLAGTPYLETTNVHSAGFGKECQPDCKASRNERCQRIDSIMKCVCRPGFARMFPDRPCKPTYTYSVKLALGSQGNSPLHFHTNLSDNSSKQYQALAVATHEGINRMVMQSDLRDVFHGVHINGFKPIDMKGESGKVYKGVLNDFYVQLSDNAHESRLKEVIEKYLRNNNYSLGGTDVHAAGELVDRLDVSDFDECTSNQFHDCSEHAQCFNLRGTYTCSCLEGFADLSVNTLYPGRICSAEPVGCDRCNYHGSCYSRDDARVLCECFQWYAGTSCQINLKVVLISLVVLGAILTVVLAVCAVVACSKKRPRPPNRSIVTCIQSMPSLHQGAMPSKQRQDRRALINERDGGDASSVQNASLPYMPAKRPPHNKKSCVISDPPAHDPPPPPAPAVMIPRARLHAHQDSRENIARKRSLELSNEAKLISYLESGATAASDARHDEMRRKHSLESSYSALNKDRHKQGALVSAGFKVSTTIRPEDAIMKGDRDDLSSVNKADLEAEMHFDSLRKSYSQEDLSEWTDAERRLGELEKDGKMLDEGSSRPDFVEVIGVGYVHAQQTLSEARSVGGTLPASTGRAASSTRQEANTMAERDLGSTFLLPHVHLYKPELTSDVSEFDSL